MNVPRLPGSPHLPTLGYLLGLLAVGALAIYIWLKLSQAKQEGK